MNILHTSVSGARASFIGQTPVAEWRHTFREHAKTVVEGKTGGFSQRNFHRDSSKPPSQNQTPAMNTFGRRCTICGSRYHFRMACDKVTEKGKWTSKPSNATVVYNSTTGRPGQGGSQMSGVQSAAAPDVPVNRVRLDSRPKGDSVYTCIDLGSSTSQRQADASTSRPTTNKAAIVNCTCDEVQVIHPLPACIDYNADSFDVGIESIVSLFDECESPVNDSIDYNNVNVTNVEFDMDRFIADSNTTLHYENLIVSDDGGNSVEVDSLFDSGTQLSVIREDLIETLQCDVLGEVKLLGFNGNMSTGKVISLNARMKDHAVSIPIRFVACQHLTPNCLLSLADYRKLLQTQEVRSFTRQNEAISAKGDDVGSFVPDAQRAHLEVSTPCTADADQLRAAVARGCGSAEKYSSARLST